MTRNSGDLTALGDRIRDARKANGLNQKDFAARAGVGVTSQQQYEAGKTAPPADYLLRLREMGHDLGFILTGAASSVGSLNQPTIGYNPGPVAPADLVDIAEVDLRYGLGATYLDSNIEVETRSFSRAWLRNFTSSPPEELFWARGQGDSMERTIQDNDILLIDRRQNTLLTSDLIWAFAFGQVGMIKRLRPMPDGSVKILSDNAAVPPETAVDDELHIVGRVVAIVKRV